MFLISSSIFNKKYYLVIFTLLFLIAINTNCLAKNISNKESKYFYPLLQEVAKKSDEKILLNDTDIEKYKKIFSMQKLGKWEEAEDIIEQLDNKILLGHVKYQKLMHPTKYRSKYNELKDWLILYSDHPMSDKIWKLADRRKPKNTKSLKKPEKLNRLAGSGRDFKSITPLENFNIPKKYNAIYKKSDLSTSDE